MVRCSIIDTIDPFSAAKPSCTADELSSRALFAADLATLLGTAGRLTDALRELAVRPTLENGRHLDARLERLLAARVAGIGPMIYREWLATSHRVSTSGIELCPGCGRDLLVETYRSLLYGGLDRRVLFCPREGMTVDQGAGRQLPLVEAAAIRTATATTFRAELHRTNLVGVMSLNLEHQGGVGARGAPVLIAGAHVVLELVVPARLARGVYRLSIVSVDRLDYAILRIPVLVADFGTTPASG